MGAKLINSDEMAKKRGCKTYCNLSFYPFLKLILEKVLNSLVRNHLLVEDVSTSLWALYHLDYLCVSATIL